VCPHCGGVYASLSAPPPKLGCAGIFGLCFVFAVVMKMCSGGSSSSRESYAPPAQAAISSGAHDKGYSLGRSHAKSGNYMPTKDALIAISKIHFPHSDNDQLQFRFGFREGFDQGK
jgi:hypothetical protein